MKKLRIFHKLKFSLEIIKNYKNWYLGFLDYFKALRKNKKIVYKLKNNARYFARAGTSDFEIINEIYVVKEYNKLLKYIKEGSVVIDIGSQIGVFSIFAAKRAKNIRVYAYEPFSENFEMLKENIKLNKLQKKVILFKLGVSGKKGKRELILCEENTGGHGFYCDGKNKVEIETTTLKDIFETNKIKSCDFLKMDCEGAEYEIIYKTPKKYLKKIKSISMEYHKNDNINKLKRFLEEKGFNVSLTDVGEGMLYAENKNGI